MLRTAYGVRTVRIGRFDEADGGDLFEIRGVAVGAAEFPGAALAEIQMRGDHIVAMRARTISQIAVDDVVTFGHCETLPINE